MICKTSHLAACSSVHWHLASRPPAHWSVRLAVCPPVRLAVRPPLDPPCSPSARPSARPSVHLVVCPSALPVPVLHIFSRAVPVPVGTIMIDLALIFWNIGSSKLLTLNTGYWDDLKKLSISRHQRPQGILKFGYCHAKWLE
jgi:hypothetical protein